MNKNISRRIKSKYWLPPLLWMAFLFPLTNPLMSSPFFYEVIERTWNILFPQAGPSSAGVSYLIIRKGLHLAAYGLLAFLVFRFIRAGSLLKWEPEWALCAAGIGLAYAGMDECLQTLRAERHASWIDFGIDALGILLALGIIYFRSRRKCRKSTRDAIDL